MDHGPVSISGGFQGGVSSQSSVPVQMQGDSRMWGDRGNPGGGDAAILELLLCGSEGAGLRRCLGELKGLWGLDVALCFTLIVSATQPAFPVMFSSL